MKFQQFSTVSVLRVALVTLSWCFIQGTCLAQSSTLEDRPYVPSASVVKGTVAALSDSSEEVAVLAVRSLADWRQASAADDIAKLLAVGPPEDVRVEAFQFFARLGPQAKPHVAAVLKYAADPDPSIRAAVLAVVLQSATSADHADTVRPLLNDSRSEVRCAAVKCLGQAGKAAVPHRQALIEALAASGSPEFKAEALRALVQIGGLTSADIDVIAPLARDRDAEVRIAAWAATLSALVEARAAGAITDEKDQSMRSALIAQFQIEPAEIKAAIVEDVGRNKAAVEASVAALVNQIRSATIETRVAALRVLGKAGEAALGQVALLTEQAKDPDSTVRAAAIAALGSLGANAVKPNLAIVANALLDPSDLVRQEALQALPAAGDALRNFPYKMRDVYPTASPEVRATLVRALPIIRRNVGPDDDMTARGRAALTDPSADIRIAMAFVMSQLGAKDGSEMLPELLTLLKDPEPAVRGAAAVALRSFVTDAASKQKLREAMRPLLKDRDTDVRWAVVDTFHELDPAQEPALVAEIAALLKDEEQTVRSAAARTLGAAGAAAKPYLLDIVHFFNDDPAVPPYAAAETIAQISPLTPQELTSLLYPLYVSSDLLPLVRLTAYSASGGEADGVLLIRLLGRSRVPAKEVMTKADEARATALLQDALKAPLLHQKLKTEIASRLTEIKTIP